MGLTLRTTHENLPAGSVVVNRRLTINEMDENFIFLQNLISGLTPITYSDAVSLRDSAEIVPGQYYLISDAQPDLYGSDSDFNFGDGTTVLIKGIDSTHFSTSGHGMFYNPNYYNGDTGYYVWDSYQTYNPNDYVIYGGRVWKLVSEGDTNPVDYFNMGNAWAAQDYTNDTYYNIVWDEIEYDFNNDFINSRYDALNNNLVKDIYNTRWFYCLSYAIQAFRWGHRMLNGMSPQYGGVSDCTVIDSYFACLNYTNGRIINVNLEGGSIMGDIRMYNSSLLTNITLKDFSTIGSDSFNSDDNIYLDNAELTNITLTNSSLRNIYLGNDSSMNNITLENNCSIYNIDFNNDDSGTNCYMEYISLKNESIISDITLNGNNSGSCYFRNINLTNESKIQNSDFYLSNSSENDVYLRRLDFTNQAEMTYIHLESNDDSSAYFEDITVSNDSYITYIEAYGTWFSNIEISSDSALAGNYEDGFADNSSFSYITITNGSNILGDYSEEDHTGDGTIYFNNSSIDYLSLSNDSLFTGPFDMNSSSAIRNFSLDCGYFGGRDQDTGNLYYIYIENSDIDNLVIERYSWMSNIDLIDSTLSNSKISNYSRISSDSDGDSVYINNSTLDYINIINHSYIGYDRVDIRDNSNWYDITIENDSKIGGYIYFVNSRLGVVSLKNNSRIWGDSDTIDIQDSDIHYLNLNNHSEINGYLRIWNGSNVQNITMDSSYLGGYNYNFIIDNSNFSFVNLTNDSYITAENDEITINSGGTGDSSTFEYVTLANNSYINGYLEVGEGSTFRNINLTNESYIEEIDVWDYSEIVDVDIKNNSYLSRIWPSNSASVRYITITDYSRFTGDINIYHSGTKVYYINIKNYSYIDTKVNYPYNGSWNLQYGSEIKYLELDNHSHIAGSLTMNNSKIKRVQMANYSKISGYNQMYSGSEIQYVSMVNVSDNSATSCYGPGFTNFYLDGASHIYGLDMKYSSVGGLALYSGSKIEGVSVDNSYWYSTYINDGAIYNSRFINSYLDSNNGSFYIYNNSYIENVVIDTVDFPSWDRRSGISVDTDSFIRNLTLRNICYIDRVSIRKNSTHYLDGMFSNMYVYNGSYIENMIIENSSEEVDTYFDKYVSNISVQNSAVIDNFRSDFSEISNIDLDGNNYISDIKLDNSIFDTITLRNYAYISFLTATDTYISDITVDDVVPSTDASYIIGAYFNSSNIAGIVLNNDSTIETLVANNSNITNINLGTYSYFNNIELKNSSSITNLDFANSSYLSQIVLENDSRFDYLNLDNSSYIRYLDLKNYSIFNGLTLDNSGLQYSQLRRSILDTFNLSDRIFSNFEMNGSKIVNFNSAGFNSYNFRMSNSYLDFYGETTPYTMASMDASVNTIKYQFEYNFNNQTTGTIDIIKLFIPGNGWYIEKVIVDADTLSSTGTTNISLGLDNAGPECVLNDVDITTLSNKVSVYDISNETMAYPGVKTTTNDTIKLVLAGDTMSDINQIIRFEVTLKKTNFSSEWWD